MSPIPLGILAASGAGALGTYDLLADFTSTSQSADYSVTGLPTGYDQFDVWIQADMAAGQNRYTNSWQGNGHAASTVYSWMTYYAGSKGPNGGTSAARLGYTAGDPTWSGTTTIRLKIDGVTGTTVKNYLSYDSMVDNYNGLDSYSQNWGAHLYTTDYSSVRIYSTTNYEIGTKIQIYGVKF